MRQLLRHYAHPLHVACRLLDLAQRCPRLGIPQNFRTILESPPLQLYARWFEAVL